MDYIYFMFCVAVMASILGFCWHRFVLKARTPGRPYGGVAAPPRKHVTDSLSEVEIKRFELQENIDVWQRGWARRLERTPKESDAPVNGQKYTFEPPVESRAKKIRRSTPRISLPQRFEMLN